MEKQRSGLCKSSPRSSAHEHIAGPAWRNAPARCWQSRAADTSLYVPTLARRRAKGARPAQILNVGFDLFRAIFRMGVGARELGKR